MTDEWAEHEADQEAKRLLGGLDDVEARAALGYLIGAVPQVALRAIKFAKEPNPRGDES